MPDVFFGKFDSDAVFNVIQNQVPPAFGYKVGDFDPRPDVIVFFYDFEQFIDMLRGFFADNQQDRPGRTKRSVNDVSFGVYGVEFFGYLPDGSGFAFNEADVQNIGKVAAADDGAAYPGQGFASVYKFELI